MPGIVNKSVPVITYQESANTLTSNIAASGAIAGKESLNFITAFNYSGAQGIQSSIINNIKAVGAPLPQDNDSYFSIAGQGMVIVKDSSNDVFYTRNGTFDIDGDGVLKNVLGHSLQAYPVNSDGSLVTKNIDSIQNLETININNLVNNPKGTTSISNVLQLPATAPIGNDSLYDQTINIYDSLGEIHSLNFAWEKTANQTWQVTVTEQKGVGNVTSAPITVVFDENGAPLTFNGANEPPKLTINWAHGAANSNINLNLGAVGTMLGVISAGNQVINRPLNIDGNTTGEYQDLLIDEDGFVSIVFSNGEIIKKYRIPLVNFPNTNGLKELGASIYTIGADSGLPIYKWAGENGVGSLNPSTIESSSIESTGQYLKLLETQMRYQANIKALHVEKEMWGDLNNI